MDNDSHLLPNKLCSNSENNEELDDSRGWKEEAEIVADHRMEDYKEDFTGIKVKYSLTKEEVRSFISRCKKHEEYKKIQRKHVILQGILFVILSVMACLSGSFYYLIKAGVPLLALVLTWAIPFINLHVSAKNLVNENEFIIDIFPDRLEIESKSGSRTMFLDNACQSEEYKDMIMVFKENEPGIVIPLRAIEPDFRADVQAIIVAGSSPNYGYYFDENF